MRIDGRRPGAHRVSWVIANGPIPKGLFICHTCDNPTCVRPSHLFVGTPTDNMADRDAKNRQAKGDRHGSKTKPESVVRGDRHGARLHPESHSGEKNGRSVLTAVQVKEIRQRYSSGVATVKDMAAEYGVAKSTMSYVVAGTTWKE